MADNQQHYPDFPATGDYGLIGDCRSAALVSRDGSIDWLCLPGFSSKSAFAAILDHRRGGRFSLRPAAAYRVSRHYLGNTPVLKTTFEAADGILAVFDAIPGNQADTGALARKGLRCRPAYARRCPGDHNDLFPLSHVASRVAGLPESASVATERQRGHRMDQISLC